jgi:uncharacterized Fe-S cluster protein YjdI/CDGSH-type Zn-finger protein
MSDVLRVPNAAEGGAGAPPEENQSNRVYDRATREYSSDTIKVQWYASRCIHSAACIRALPQVFNPRQRPWVKVDAANADAIADAVVKCPTGALHFVRNDGGAQEQPPPAVTVTPVRNGPFLIQGQVQITDASGQIVRDDWRVALCRCGRSKRLPFCDNTHRALGIRIDDDAEAGP